MAHFYKLKKEKTMCKEPIALSTGPHLLPTVVVILLPANWMTFGASAIKFFHQNLHCLLTLVAACSC